MTSRFTLGLSLVAVLAGSTASAQPAQKPSAAAADPFEAELDKLFAPGGLTAEQAAGRAAKTSASVLRRSAEIEAAIAQTETAELARIPQLSGRVQYTRLSPIDPVVLGGFTIPVFLNSTIAEAQVGVPLSDYLFRFPRLIEAAKLGEQAARLSKQSTEVNAAQDARLAFYEWVRARLQVLVAQRQLVNVQATVGQFRALAEAQRMNRADLMRVESQEATAEQTVDALQNLANLREEQLRILIGAGPEEQLSIGEDVRGEIGAPAAGKLDDLVGTAKHQRLEFRAIDIALAAKDKQRAADEANRIPRLSAFAIADYANPNQRVFPQQDKFAFTWSVGAQLTWSLNDTLVSRATERRIQAEANELRADRTNLERGTRIEVLAAQQAVAIAQHALQTTAKGQQAAEESYRVRRELLNADRGTAVELVDAETDLTRARIASLNARVDLRVALVQLGHALGNDAK